MTETGRRRRRRVALLPLVAIACVFAVALLSRSGGSALRGSGDSWQPAATRSALRHHRAAKGRFGIAGAIRGLYPGASQQLTLTVTNPQRFAIVVGSIVTTVRSHTAGCGAFYLTVGHFSGRLRIRRHGSSEVAVPVTLRRSAPNACQGAVFRLLYGGRARKAR